MSQLLRYESYKESGVQWLGKIPSHWEVKRMKFVVSNIGDKVDAKESDLRYFGLENIESFTGKLLNSVELESEGIGHRFKKDDVLFGKLRPYLAKVFLAEEDGLSSTEALVFRSSEVIYPKFLSYYCLSQDFINEVNGTTFGSKMPRASWDDIASFKVVYPNLDEQKIIADFLDKRLAQVDALISKQEILLEKLAEQRVALISHAVTKGLKPDVEMKESHIKILGNIPSHWEIIKNKFIFDFSKGLTITKENLVDEGIPCVSYGEVHSKFGFEVDPIKHQLKCVPEAYIESDENSLLKSGDFIFADTSEDVKGAGNFTYLNSDIPTFAGYHTIIAKMSKLNNPRFLAYILDTEEHRNQIRMLIKGVKVFSITQAILKNTFVWLPPIEEQNQIVDYLDQEVEKYQQIGQRYELTIKRLKEYRSTLITQVVTGKIDVRNLKVN
ncbi:restriction endonuclease subunit S [Acinetobacter sp. AS23]|uniref:restriction endonuclease subunit S n=1 Tax=Acinetobacter sp. AS23 TaxID=2871688 RepID=UPI0020274CE6|nr:restriction endonuclease subunit S [Acinetobacter sp. AS23]URM40191.1 restriction endonuclease subunit S [Acinetobacter sp. AS23]